MNRGLAWESPLPELGHAHQFSRQPSLSPTSTPTWTPPDHHTLQQSLSYLNYPAAAGMPDPCSTLPMTFDWTQFYSGEYFFDLARRTAANRLRPCISDILCHLWFRQQPQIQGQNFPATYHHPITLSKHQALSTRPTFAFRCFVQRVIQATAVSQAVLVLSLWYIERLRLRNISAVASAGSEYRLCATGLMLANKYLDDNTYTSKTWSSMTGIPLNEMNVSRSRLDVCSTKNQLLSTDRDLL
jgi:hypothetical protein